MPALASDPAPDAPDPSDASDALPIAPDAANPFTMADYAEKVDGMMELARQETLLKTGALQKAIFNSANRSEERRVGKEC